MPEEPEPTSTTVANGGDAKACLQKLFREARSKGGLQYIFTLVRVEGLTGTADPLLALRSVLAGFASSDHQATPDDYRSIANREDALSLVVNLIRCCLSQAYEVSPFLHLYRGRFPNVVKPSPVAMAEHTSRVASEAGWHDLADLITASYDAELLGVASPGAPNPNDDRLQTPFRNCLTFLRSMIEICFAERLSYKNAPQFYKMPRFEVLELLIEDEWGLSGFQVHFSNGGSARFVRSPEGTDCTNVELHPDVGFFVGMIDELRDEWRVGDKRLYEIGLPGRYNKLGEWKPIIYPGNTDALQKEACSLSNDDDVQGALFYMMCTGHRVIEFVVRTTIELPIEAVTIGSKLHLWKCPPLEESSRLGQNFRLYDGWVELDSVDPESIRAAIAMIAVAVNRLAFAYGASLTWCLKYRMVLRPEACATPSEDDLKLFDSLLQRFPRSEDAIFLDAAMDWYNRGRSSRNVFMAFLCYYIALESVAIAVEEGKADLGLEYSKETNQSKSERRLDCIRSTLEALYPKDPIQFVRRAYFDCVLSLKEKTRRVAEEVFGAGHPYLKALFDPAEDGHSLYDLRGKLAHGEFALLDKQDEDLVANRVREMASISKEFLTRIMFLLKPNEVLPTWSGRHMPSLMATDPRSILVARHEAVLPTKDWRIRPEWCQ